MRCDPPLDKQKMLELRATGMSYRKIAKEIGCCKSSVMQHINYKYRAGKFKYTNNWRKNNRLKQTLYSRVVFFQRPIVNSDKKIQEKTILKIYQRVDNFANPERYKTSIRNEHMFTTEQLLEKIGSEPKCYITGKPIDLSDTKSWHLDHKVPRSKGGDNSLENCGIASREANYAKFDKTLQEFLDLCVDVLKHNGYAVTKNIG